MEIINIIICFVTKLVLEKLTLSCNVTVLYSTHSFFQSISFEIQFIILWGVANSTLNSSFDLKIFCKTLAYVLYQSVH